VSSAHNKILLLVEFRTMYHVGQTRRYDQTFHENDGVCLVTVDCIESGCRHVKKLRIFYSALNCLPQESSLKVQRLRKCTAKGN